MTTKDALWKAIIEEFFDDFLQFFFTPFYDKIDTNIPFEVLDKELSKLYPETQSINRNGDKLIKIKLKEGQEHFILVHVEVQGYKEEDYGRRMYICQYRIDERFNLPLTALVIYTDANKENRVNFYERNCFGTTIKYEFNTFVISEKTVEEYEKLDNPFAIICQVTLIGLQRNLKDEALFEQKIALFRKLLDKNYPKNKIRLLTTFIKNYVHFTNTKFYRKFDEQVDIISNNNQPMGLYETIIEYRTKEAKQAALEQGLEQGLELEKYLSSIIKALETIEKGIKGGLSNQQLTIVFGYPKLFIEEYLANKINFKSLNLKLKKLRKKFVAEYGLSNLQYDLVKLFLLEKFSVTTITKVLKVKEVIVKKVQKEIIRQQKS